MNALDDQDELDFLDMCIWYDALEWSSIIAPSLGALLVSTANKWNAQAYAQELSEYNIYHYGE